jgi:hypothetical protein
MEQAEGPPLNAEAQTSQTSVSAYGLDCEKTGRDFYRHIASRYLNIANDLNSLKILLENEVAEFLDLEYANLPYTLLSVSYCSSLPET